MPGLVLSSPPRSSTDSPRRRSPKPSEPTNTLILTSLPPAFFHPTVLEPLREHFASYGEIMSWAPIKSFGRVIVAFWNTQDAERLREETDYLKIGDDESSQVTLRLYRGEPTPFPSSTPDIHLHPPAQTKNFLISPPGSPPVGWEPVEESAPNTSTLAADLVAALNRLQIAQGRGERQDGKEVLMRPGEDGGGLAVFLEDCDGAEQDGQRTPEEIIEVLSSAHEDSEARRGTRSGIHHVKATISSMGVVPDFMSGGSQSFVPTAMPPRPAAF